MFIRRHVVMDSDGGDGGQGGGGTGSASPQGTGAAGGDGGATKPWYSEFKDPDTKAWLGSFKEGTYPDPESLAIKAFNLERFMGAEKAGRGVILPKPDAKPEEWQAFWKKTGAVPDKPDGYKIDEALAKDPMVIKLRDHAHKIGMPAQFLQETLNWYGQEAKAMMEAQAAEFEQRGEADMQKLHTDWGASYDAKVEAGRRAAKMFIPHNNPEELENLIHRMEGAIGTYATMNIFANIGERISEHGFVDGDGTSAGGGITPEGARLRIRELKADTEWASKFAAGDADARREWDKLHKIGYPEPKQ